MNRWDEAEQRARRAGDFYQRGQWAEALSELQAAIDINPYNASWHFNLGLTFEAMDRTDDAIAAYRRALEIEPHDMETLAALGANHVKSQRFDEAIDFFDRVERIDPAFEPAYCHRIIAYAEKGLHDKAEEMFYLARQYKEECPACYFNMGSSLFARGNYEKALWCWQRVTTIEPAYPCANARIAEAFWAKGQLGEAKAHFIEELRNNPGDLDTLLDLGELLMELGDHRAAGEKFRQVLELSPDEATAIFHLGQLALDEGDHVLALENFRRVLSLDRAFAGAHLKIAQIYLAQEDRSEAIFHGNCELAQQNLDVPLLVELGDLFMNLQQHGSARTAFDRALAIQPQHAEARHNLAVTLLLDGCIDEGIEQAKLALRTQPKFMLAMHNLALAYLTKRDFTRARFFLREAMDIAPDDPQLKTLQTKIKIAAFVHGVKNWPMKLLRRAR